MQKKFVSALIALTACTSLPSRQDAMHKANQDFAGQPLSEFSINYGKPLGKAETVTGGKLYHWVSLGHSAPPDSQAFHNFAGPNGTHYGFYDPAVSRELQYCKLDIETNKKNIIRKITFVQDTPGKWGSSLCAEIFAPN